MRRWQRHLFYTTESVKTTWKLRLALLVVVATTGILTRGLWAAWIARSLVCTEGLASSDVILVENFDPDYLVFKRAAQLMRAGLAPRAFVPVRGSDDIATADPVAKGIADLMAQQARLGPWEPLPIKAPEPISLNTARQIRRQVVRDNVRSMIIVTPGFRSRRTALIYRHVLKDRGTQIFCAPVFGQLDPERWTERWHGIQEVVEESLKLQYYRLYVLPFLARQ